MKNGLRVIGIMVLGSALFAWTAPGAVPSEKSPKSGESEKSNTRASQASAYQKFRTEQMRAFVKYRSDLMKEKGKREDVQAKLKDYGKKMIAEYEKFAASPEGGPFAQDARKEIITIAAQLTEDPEKIREVIATEKDPEKGFPLKLFAARMLGQIGQSEEAGKLIDEIVAAAKDKNPALAKDAEAMRFQVAPKGLPFPEFPEGTKDTEGKDIKIADYKGKVVMVDFWAAWCGPCMAEAPNVVKAYEKYHPKGFEIIGISLDKSKDDMEKAMKEKGMTWRQYFDGLYWQSKVGRAYGINAIPATYLVGPDGKIVTSNVRGPKLEAELGKLLSGEK